MSSQSPSPVSADALCEVVNRHNSFYHNRLSYYCFLIPLEGSDKLFGYIHPENVEHLQRAAGHWFNFNHKKALVVLKREFVKYFESSFEDIRKALNDYEHAPWSKKLMTYKDEKWPLLGFPWRVGMLCDLAPIFGTVTLGVHLTIFQGRGEDMKIWVAQRAMNKTAFPGLLDQCAAGGFNSDQDKDVTACLEREMREEIKSGLCPSIVEDAKRCDPIEYFNLRDKTWGDLHVGLPEPGIRVPFEYEIKGNPQLVGEETVTNGISCMSVGEVRRALVQRKWKPSSALIMIDFLLRHRLVEKETVSARLRIEDMGVYLRLGKDLRGLPTDLSGLL